MLAIALALGASLSWGLGDFLGGLKSRTLHVLTVLVVSQVFGLAAALSWVAASGDGVPSWSATAWPQPPEQAAASASRRSTAGWRSARWESSLRSPRSRP